MKQSLLLTVLLCGVLFGGCGRMTPRNYLTSLSAAEVADAAADGLAEEFRTADADYLSDYVTLPQSSYTLCVRIATGGDCIDEYGILHTDIDIEGAERLIREYLARSYEENRAFYDSYIPAETPKLRDAQVRVYGDYVVYAILSPADRDRLFDRIEACLSE